ncbi:MAG: helix-turn-helix transcriptional regulator [Oscillospiraceae bacterium]|nr:helix-turn-helix transcriptional regulator [Oscillospiraceae bacterium]
MKNNKNTVDRSLCIPENIFIKCTYSADIRAHGDWFHKDGKTAYHNLVLVYDGAGNFECGGKKYTVQRGDLVFFPMGSKRNMTVGNSKFLAFYSFNFQYSMVSEHDNVWSTNYYPLPLAFVKHIDDNGLFIRLEELFLKILKDFAAMQPNSAYKTRFYATEILSLLLNENRENVSFSQRNTVNKSIEYMSEHFSEKITLKELADISGKSVSYYGKTFKSIMGITPIEYLLKIRISYAKTLLESNTSVTDTARLCGFSDLYYFSKLFFKKEHISPSEYKRIAARKRPEK